EHLVVDDVAELDLHHHRDLVARRLLVAVERGRPDRDAGDVALEHGVGAGALGHDLVAAAADELEADAGGQRLLDVEHRRGVGEERHADGPDVRRERGAAAGQRIAAPAERHERQRHEDEGEGGERPAAHGVDHLTTMLTRRPLATTTLTMVLPAVWAWMAGSD